MNPTKKYYLSTVGALLLGASTNSGAVLLGHINGAAIVGQGLNLTVPIQLDGSETMAAVCVDADVFYGDTKLGAGKVSLGREGVADSKSFNLRIKAADAVDEPVVTVYLREGCTQKSTRKYVLLADPLSGDNATPVAAMQPIRLPKVVAAPSATYGSTPSSRDTGLEPVVVPKRRSHARTVERTASTTKAAVERKRSAAAVVAKPQPEAVASGQSRLKLDPVDLASERNPVLQASSELLSKPSDDPQQRASAAALWQAINAQPQDVLQDSQRLKSMESDVSNMLAQTKKSQQAVTELRSQLEQARSQRYNNWLVYLLGGLAALAMAAAAALWTRSRQNSKQPWWGQTGQAPLDPKLQPEPSAAAAGGAKGMEASSSGLDLDLGDATSSYLGLPLNSSAISLTDHSVVSVSDPGAEFNSSMMGISRTVNAEELMDVQQQADFFLSLGQVDKAVEVLRGHIQENVDTSALAYLDLFDLYHRYRRVDEYESLRKDFNRVFNAQVPPFDLYTNASRGLDFDDTALNRIEALWPNPKVLDVIEESIFRKPDSKAPAFNLTAYRELLLLYAIAKEIASRPNGAAPAVATASGVGPGSRGKFPSKATSGAMSSVDFNADAELPRFLRTNIEPLTAPHDDLDALPSASAPLAVSGFEPVSSGGTGGLDIDLSGDSARAPLHPLPMPLKLKPMPAIPGKKAAPVGAAVEPAQAKAAPTTPPSTGVALGTAAPAIAAPSGPSASAPAGKDADPLSEPLPSVDPDHNWIEFDLDPPPEKK